MRIYITSLQLFAFDALLTLSEVCDGNRKRVKNYESGPWLTISPNQANSCIQRLFISSGKIKMSLSLSSEAEARLNTI
jgi:hypothetical protein